MARVRACGGHGIHISDCTWRDPAVRSSVGQELWLSRLWICCGIYREVTAPNSWLSMAGVLDLYRSDFAGNSHWPGWDFLTASLSSLRLFLPNHLSFSVSYHNGLTASQARGAPWLLLHSSPLSFTGVSLSILLAFLIASPCLPFIGPNLLLMATRRAWSRGLELSIVSSSHQHIEYTSASL